MNALAILPESVRRAALEILPDTDRYKCRFKIASQTSDQIYLISFDSANGAGYWTCSCFGCRRGQCKHLTAMGLKGRKFGKDFEWLKKLQME